MVRFDHTWPPDAPPLHPLVPGKQFVGRTKQSSCVCFLAQAVLPQRGELLVEELDDPGDAEHPSQPATAAAAVVPSTWTRQQQQRLATQPHPSPQIIRTSQAPPALHPAAAAAGEGGGGVCGGRSSVLPPGEPLAVSSMREVDMLLWGSIRGCPSAAWCQGFVFSSTPGLWWGLVQYQGGPCGVLAAVQAHLIATLMEQVGGEAGQHTHEHSTF
jgi:hypothetical protein